MTSSHLGPSALSLVVCALRNLIPDSHVRSVYVNGNVFSFSVELSKKIGEEFSLFLREEILALCRKKSLFRSFSMVPQVLEGYLKHHRHLVVDERVLELLDEVEESGSSQIVDVLEVDQKFITLQEEGCEYLPSAEALKWTECFATLEEPGPFGWQYVMRGVCAHDAKGLKEGLKQLRSMVDQNPRHFQTYFMLLESPDGTQSVMTPEGVRELTERMAPYAAQHILLPTSEILFDEMAPIGALQEIRSLWLRIRKGMNHFPERCCSVEKIRVKEDRVRLMPLSGLKEVTLMLLFQKQMPLGELSQLITSMALSRKLNVELFFSKKISRKRKEDVKKFFEIESVERSSLKSSEVCILMSSLAMDGMKDPIYRAAVLMSLSDCDDYLEDLLILPMLSYEREVMLRSTTR